MLSIFALCVFFEIFRIGRITGSQQFFAYCKEVDQEEDAKRKTDLSEFEEGEERNAHILNQSCCGNVTCRSDKSQVAADRCGE